MAGNMASVLLDTSVWIDALRGKTPHIVEATEKLLKDDRLLLGLKFFDLRD